MLLVLPQSNSIDPLWNLIPYFVGLVPMCHASCLLYYVGSAHPDDGHGDWENVMWENVPIWTPWVCVLTCTCSVLHTFSFWDGVFFIFLHNSWCRSATFFGRNIRTSKGLKIPSWATSNTVLPEEITQSQIRFSNKRGIHI